MARLPMLFVGEILVAAVVFAFVVDFAKSPYSAASVLVRTFA
jgi:hypothetical protein